MTSFIDTHCHLDKLDSTPEVSIPEAKKAGVKRMITISVDESSLDFVSVQTKKYKEVFGSAGVHPHEASSMTEYLEEKIFRFAQEQKKIIAIGETGLDYHYMHCPEKVQQKVFRKHLQIADKLNLPVILHSREAETDTLNIIRDYSVNSLGVAHSFTGSFNMAKNLLEMGWYLGINGIVTFKNAEDLRKLVSWLPLDKLLLETDSPYLAPVPFRGKTNKPAHIPVIAEFVAGLKKISTEKLAEQTLKNSQQLFKLLI